MHHCEGSQEMSQGAVMNVSLYLHLRGDADLLFPSVFTGGGAKATTTKALDKHPSHLVTVKQNP